MVDGHLKAEARKAAGMSDVIECPAPTRMVGGTVRQSTRSWGYVKFDDMDGQGKII